MEDFKSSEQKVRINMEVDHGLVELFGEGCEVLFGR